MILINRTPCTRTPHIYATVITIFYLLSAYHSLPNPNSLHRRAISLAKGLEEAVEQAKAASTASAAGRLPPIAEEISEIQSAVPEIHSAVLPSLGHSHSTEEKSLPPIHPHGDSQSHDPPADLPPLSPKPHGPKLETVSKPNFFKQQMLRFKKYWSHVKNFFTKITKSRKAPSPPPEAPRRVLSSLDTFQPGISRDPVLERQTGRRVSSSLAVAHHDKFISDSLSDSTSIRDARQKQIENYRVSRERFGQLMFTKSGHPSSDWDPKALAQSIGKELDPSGKNPKLTSLLEPYLENIQHRVEAISSLHPLKTEWVQTKQLISEHQFIDLNSLARAEEEITSDVIKTLRKTDPREFDKRFTPELNQVLDIIDSKTRLQRDDNFPPLTLAFAPRKTRQELMQQRVQAIAEIKKKWGLTTSSDSKYFFPSPLLIHERSDNRFENFVQARALQMTTSEPGRVAITSRSVAEDVIPSLPKDLDLLDEVSRFSMLKGIEKVFKDIQPEVFDYVHNLVTQRLEKALPVKVDLNEVFRPLFLSTTKEDEEWKEGLFIRASSIHMSPSEIFEKLKQPPNSKTQLRYTLSNPPHKPVFVPSLELLGEQPHQLMNARMLKLALSNNLEEARKAAEILLQHGFNDNAANLPFIDELFQKGAIDAATRTRLHNAGKISREELINALGSEADFKRELLQKHGEEILSQVVKHHSNSPESNKIATKFITGSYVRELNHNAKAIYLTPDAFLKPYSFNLDKAWAVYDQKAITEYVHTRASDTDILRAFVNAQYPPPPRERLVGMDKFLSRIKIPQEPRGELFEDEFAGFDERLLTIFHHPLTENDARLEGTSYEGLSAEAREQLNSIVSEIFSNRKKIEEHIDEIPILEREIKEAEDKQLAAELPRLGGVFNGKLHEALGSTDEHPSSVSPVHLGLQPIDEESSHGRY